LIYLKLLVAKSNLPLEMSIEKISKKTASRLIEYFLKGTQNKIEIRNILNRNY